MFFVFFLVSCYLFERDCGPDGVNYLEAVLLHPTWRLLPSRIATQVLHSNGVCKEGSSIEHGKSCTTQCNAAGLVSSDSTGGQSLRAGT